MKIHPILDTSSRTFQVVFTACLSIFATALLSTMVYSWNGPSSSPPNGNVAAPINVGSASQAKSGPLQVNGFLNSGSSQLNGNVGIGGGPSSAWSIYARSSSRGYGILADATDGQAIRGRIRGGGNGWAGYFQGGRGVYVEKNVRANAFYYNSDLSLKDDIKEIDDASSIIQKLRGVSFTWKENNEKNIGLIAQEVEEVLPELVNTDPGTGLKSVQYASLVAPLIEAVKEQQKEIDNLQKQIDTLQTQVNALQE